VLDHLPAAYAPADRRAVDGAKRAIIVLVGDARGFSIAILLNKADDEINRRPIQRQNRRNPATRTGSQGALPASLGIG
jgi:hypothetical protein